MLKSISIFVFVSFVLTSKIYAQPGIICNWNNNKQAAVVLTFDDWSPGHYPAVVPELKNRGLTATFYPMITSIANWNHPWPDVIETVSYGNEMGNHSNTHPKLTQQSTDKLSEEIRKAKQILDDNLTAQTVLTFDYPFGDYNNQVIDSVKNAGHIAARGVNKPTNYKYNFATSDRDYYELKAYAMGSNTSLHDYNNEIDKVINGGGLLVYMYHSVDDANGTFNDNWYAKVLLDSLKNQLDILVANKNKIWVTTLSQAIKYHREANCASLTEVEPFNGKKLVLNLSDTLSDNTIYNQPLSIKLKTNGVIYNEVYQNGQKLNIDSVFNDTLLFKAIPDAGLITLHSTTYDTIFANNKLIEYTGRIDFSDSLAPKFSYSGISIGANFEGTSIAAILDDDTGENYYNVLIDGKVTSVIKVTKGKKSYVLAQNLEDKQHEVELFKRTELTFGKTVFFGFMLDEGKNLLPITKKRDLLIEYIGNSITCGYGNEGKNGDDFLAETENHFQTYAAITSRNFNARHMAVSRSGIGIYRNYDGPATGNDDCMSNLYTNTFLYDENPKYDFAVQPNLVCINLGTNDFSTNGGDSALYVDNYFRLIDTIQEKYNMPEIVCLLGSMMSGNTLTNVRKYLQFISDSATQKGKGKVHFFEMSGQTGDLGIGVHYHPTVAQHKKNASELTEFLQSLKNWKVSPQISSAKTLTTNEIQIVFNTNIKKSNENFNGFKITSGTTTFNIKSFKTDETNAKILNLVIEEQFMYETEIELHYEPGTIESADGIILEEQRNFKVENTLSKTSIKSSYIKTNGTYIKLTFNKKLSPDSDINGLSFFSNNNTFLIDSFSITAQNLTSYISPIIDMGESVFCTYNGTDIYAETDKVILDPFTDLAIENTSLVTSFKIENNIKKMKIWPNPNSSGIISYKGKFSNKANYVIIHNSGQIVTKGLLNNPNGLINIGSNLSNGIYLVKFLADNFNETHELLINN